ncbi:UPF0716 protein FxsA [Motilibacter rhizosphaerae]|uniref:UPF0716 protein FxsA n=1 Tax=Motilibacter rhizosphaerae TaxID=598652 RepID=A0A4Q7NB04_9ACTN|nr:FxsA family protein [Motilibacter rhizosphaerae]RZS80096.1 UPF0716 protein FxsA [Motilibacter rhizosphaerae]
MPLLLVVVFLVVPIAEIAVIIRVGEAIGGWQTFGLLVLESLLGGWIVKREGRRAWRELRASLARGGLPTTELLDAALVLIGGTLLLTPGFLTDVVGFFLVLPPTRPLARRLAMRTITRRVARRAERTVAGWGRPGAPRDGRVVPGDVIEGQVVEGHVVDDSRDGRDGGRGRTR